MKKIIVLLIVVSTILMLSVSLAASSIGVQLDGQFIDFKDEQGNVVEPQIINDRTMVPLRKIFEALDCKITWEELTKSVVAVSGNKEIRLTINNPVATVTNLATNEKNTITLDSAPVIVDDRTLVPVRFIAESLEKNVDWDSENRAVIIIDYDKLAQTFRSKVPALQDLFDFKIGDMKSFKSASIIDGQLTYAGGGSNEQVTMTGNATINVNDQELEATIKVDFAGNDGEIINALKEAGYDHINYKFVLKGGKLYSGASVDGVNYQWEELTETLTSEVPAGMISESNLDNIKFGSYEDVVNILKNNIGAADIYTYSTLLAAFDSVGKLISKDTVKLTQNGADATLSISLDFGAFISQFMGESSDVLDGFKLIVKTDINKKNGVLSSDNTKVEIMFTLPEAEEQVVMNSNFATTYTDVNGPVVINAPVM